MKKILNDKNFSNNEVTHVMRRDIEYLTFKALEKYKEKILCVVTLRHGGVSEGVYGSLNVRMLGNDKKSNVYENVRRISEIINIDRKYICKGRQAHTDNVLYINDANMNEYLFEKENNEEIDGYITDSNSLATLITTADCNAIVIYDPVKNVASNIHSGWKGTTKKIYLKAINMMKEKFDSKEQDLIVCVSPSILSCCFSSEDENFKKIFTNIWEQDKDYITIDEYNPKRFHIDLPYVITKDLINVGVKKSNIHFAGICTCCNDEHFYSYRSKTQKGEDDYGCMATIVKLL